MAQSKSCHNSIPRIVLHMHRQPPLFPISLFQDNCPSMLIIPHFLALLLVRHVSAILPEAQIVRQDDRNQVPGPQSLPNLLDLTSADDLAQDWTIQGDMVLESGRLVVKKNLGSIWAHKVLENAKDEWTIEVVFRNSEQVDVDEHNFYDTNGFAFWLLDASGLMLNEFSNFGGPQRFDGFQFLINNKEQRGLKIFASDGSRDTVNLLETSLGGCGINYLDSMVPFTLRISYSGRTDWFKVQIDNNLCFKTDSLTFANIKRDLRFGVSASTDEVSQEYWEVLKLNVYPYLTENAIDDHGIISEGSIKQITEQVKPTVSPQVTRQSLMEKTRQFKEELTGNADQQSGTNFDSSLIEISSKLVTMEELLNKLEINKVSDLATALADVKQIQLQQLEVLQEMKSTYKNFESLLASQYKEMGRSIAELHESVINEIKDHQAEVLDISMKVDLIMANHKDLADQYRSTTEVFAAPDSSEFFSVVLKWVLLPIVIGIAVLTLFVYRLRKDIKHSKLL